MTPQEAIEQIKLAQAEVKWKYSMEYAVAFDKAIEALNKQIPIKPILKNRKDIKFVDYSDGHGEMKVSEYQDWTCPKCGWYVGERFNYVKDKILKNTHDQRQCKYCDECGQKLKWGA